MSHERNEGTKEEDDYLRRMSFIPRATPYEGESLAQVSRVLSARGSIGRHLHLYGSRGLDCQREEDHGEVGGGCTSCSAEITAAQSGELPSAEITDSCLERELRLELHLFLDDPLERQSVERAASVWIMDHGLDLLPLE